MSIHDEQTHLSKLKPLEKKVILALFEGLKLPTPIRDEVVRQCGDPTRGSVALSELSDFDEFYKCLERVLHEHEPLRVRLMKVSSIPLW